MGSYLSPIAPGIPRVILVVLGDLQDHHISAQGLIWYQGLNLDPGIYKTLTELSLQSLYILGGVEINLLHGDDPNSTSWKKTPIVILPIVSQYHNSITIIPQFTPEQKS